MLATKRHLQYLLAASATFLAEPTCNRETGVSLLVICLLGLLRTSSTPWYSMTVFAGIRIADLWWL